VSPTRSTRPESREAGARGPAGRAGRPGARAELTRAGRRLRRYLYEGALEAQLAMVFDANKRLLKASDAYPEAVQLAKGAHIVRAQLRTDNAALLERLRATPLARPAVQALACEISGLTTIVRGHCSLAEFSVEAAAHRTLCALEPPPRCADGRACHARLSARRVPAAPRAARAARPGRASIGTGLA